MKRQITFFIVVALSIGMLATPAHAWPDKDLTYMIPSSPGGGSDTLGRTFVPFLEKELGVSIAVVNKPGGGGSIGLAALAKAAPDGYTIGQANLPQMVSKPIENPKIPFSAESFDVIGTLEDDPWVIAVMKDHEYKSFEDLSKAAKANPGKINCAGSGIGGSHHLAYVQFREASGIELNFVPMEGGSEARAALLGGHVPMACVATGGVNRVADKVRVLAIASDKRSPIYPYAPTMKEMGIDLAVGSTRTLVAPKGVPADVLDKLRSAFDKIVADPAFAAKMKGVKKNVDGTNGAYTEKRIVKAEKTLKAVWDKSPWIER